MPQVYINARNGGRVSYRFVVDGQVNPTYGESTGINSEDNYSIRGDGTVEVTGGANGGEDTWNYQGDIVETEVIDSSGSWYAEINGERVTQSGFASYASGSGGGEGSTAGGLLSSLTENQKWLVAGVVVAYLLAGDDLDSITEELTQGNRPYYLAAAGGYWYLRMGGRERVNEWLGSGSGSGGSGMGGTGGTQTSATPNTGGL